MKKKLPIMIFALISILVLCSCSIKSKRQLISYAENEFGSCEFIKQDVTGQGNSEVRTVYLRDDDTGIEYTVTSRMTSLNVDGSILGYTEQTSSDFSGLYWDYVIDKTQAELDSISDKYNVDLSDLSRIMFCSRPESGQAEAAASEVYSAIKQYDGKDILNPSILVYAENSDLYLGVLEGGTGKWTGSDPYKVVDHVLSIFPEAEYSSSIYGTPESYVDPDDMALLRAHGCRDTNTFDTEFFFFSEPEYGTLVAFDLEEIGLNGIFIAEYAGYGPGRTLDCDVLGIHFK